MQYTFIPRMQEWLRDSSVSFAIRHNDAILKRIDQLVGDYHSLGNDKRYYIVVCDLFLTLDYWLKIYRTNSTMVAARAPAIQALYEAAARQLCGIFNCTINGLPREMELMWGREMSGGGVVRDLVEQASADYLTRKEAAIYRLRFRGGHAYQLPWWKPGSKEGYVLAESSKSYNQAAFVLSANRPEALPNKNYGFFVMSTSRDIYMSEHQGGAPGDRNGSYHSKYTAGGPVAAAGSMLIEMGVIKRIREDSGHYMPHGNNMLGLLMALQMFGVSLTNVFIEDFKGLKATKAAEYLKAQGNWDKLCAKRDETVLDNQYAFSKRPAPDLSKCPDPRSRWGNRPYQKDVMPPAIRQMSH